MEQTTVSVGERGVEEEWSRKPLTQRADQDPFSEKAKNWPEQGWFWA